MEYLRRGREIGFSAEQNTVYSRRELLRLCGAGVLLSGLNRGCNHAANNPGNGPVIPDPPEEVFILTEGRTLYDDFDGHGNLQTYDDRDLAEEGRLSSKLWSAWTGWGTADIVPNPVEAGLLTVIDESGRRVDRGRREEGGAIKDVFEDKGRRIETARRVPGRPDSGSRIFLWKGARDGFWDDENGRFFYREGETYGLARILAFAGGGNVLQMTNRQPIGMSCSLDHPIEVDFADNKSFSADVLLSSASTSRDLAAVLDYHTTIPEQPPGKSWFIQLGIQTMPSGEMSIVGQCANVNTGYRFLKPLEEARLDVWYNLRFDIVTRNEDSRLNEKEFRVDFFVNGILKAWEFPEDGEILLDPRKRTGVGPKRILTIYTRQDDRTCVAFFDNVRAVYRNRIR